jgi:hypothetical protein
MSSSSGVDGIPRMTSTGATHIAVRRSIAEGWQVFGDVTYTGLQAVGCGGDDLVVIGETSTTLDAAEWRTIDLDGHVVDTRPLPEEAVLGREADFSTASFIDRQLDYVAAGTSGIAAVRDFGTLEQIDAVIADGGPDDPYPVLDRRIIVLTGPGSPALVQPYDGSRMTVVEGSTALPDGRIVSLVHRRTGWDGDDDTFELLVAE